jgi:hypothetical protein
MSRAKEMNDDMGAHRSDLVRAGDVRTDETARLPAVPQSFVAPPEVVLASPPDARDISAELAAPPRRRMPWLTLGLVGGIVAALAFSGGVWYQKDHGTGTGTGTGGGTGRAGAFAGAAGTGAQRAGGYGGFGGYGAAGGYGRAGAPGGEGQTGTGTGSGTAQGQGQSTSSVTTGTVKVVDGNTVYLTDAQGNTVKITTKGTTKVKLSKDGQVADLLPGDTVVIQGTRDSSGNLAATQVTQGSGVAAGGLGGGLPGSGG